MLVKAHFHHSFILAYSTILNRIFAITATLRSGFPRMFVATWVHCSCAQCWMDLPGLTRGGGGGEGSLLQLVTGSLITIHWTRLSVSFLCTQCIKIIVIVEFSFAPFCWEKNSLVLLLLLLLLLLLMMLPLYSLLNFSNSFCVCNKYLVPFHPTELQRNSSLKLELKEFSVEKPTAVSRIRCKEHGAVTLTEVPDSKSYQVDSCCKQIWRQNSDLMKSRNDFSPRWAKLLLLKLLMLPKGPFGSNWHRTSTT